ncbi:hypothetical protein [Haloarcula argentinensis]|uniref:Uncharacterized protein n=1 Tax=Haloarcula argentinensis TaxID=43776 RepID=A0A847ULW1_HALAR|nr:hypothetical protein [Haloarcula argentinensis]NLV12168.1 hypothetical protein [Haloarcula argentinensis]
MQLLEKTISEKLCSTSQEDYVHLQNPSADIQPIPTIPARVEKVDEDGHVGKGEVGIGTNLHQALGVEIGDSIQIIEEETLRPYGEQRFNKLLRTRPAICRVRKSVFPDPEFRVCRLPKSVMKLIGIEEGDQVVLESYWGQTTVRALEMTPDIRHKKYLSWFSNPSRYPVGHDMMDINQPLGTPVDIPDIYIDYDTRAELGFAKGEGTGILHPVRVYRNNRSIALKFLNDLVLPSFALLVSLVLLIGSYFSRNTAILVVILGFVGVIVSLLAITIYRARKAI